MPTHRDSRQRPVRLVLPDRDRGHKNVLALVTWPLLEKRIRRGEHGSVFSDRINEEQLGLRLLFSPFGTLILPACETSAGREMSFCPVLLNSSLSSS